MEYKKNLNKNAVLKQPRFNCDGQPYTSIKMLDNIQIDKIYIVGIISSLTANKSMALSYVNYKWHIKHFSRLIIYSEEWMNEKEQMPYYYLKRGKNASE